MDSPSVAELQAVPLAAWRGAVLLADASLDEWHAAVAAQLSTSKFPGGLARPGVRVISPTGTRYLAALRALVDGLDAEQARVLALTEMYKSDGPFRRRREMPAWAGAWRSGNCFASSDLGRAALLLSQRDSEACRDR